MIQLNYGCLIFLADSTRSSVWSTDSLYISLNLQSTENFSIELNMAEFSYHGEWYTLLIIDIIDWNDLEKIVYSSYKIYSNVKFQK